MDDENDYDTSSEASNTNEPDSFPRITAVATEWMLDFLFVSLCRRFKERKLNDFNETLKAFEIISQSSSLTEKSHEKTLICAFLARVMHGKELDVLFEEDESVMPLMSAAKIWLNLNHTVTDESLFKNTTILLLIQSVAVCMEKGKRSFASSALRWFDKHQEFPQNLTVKLSTIVTQRDTYHPFFMSFSFSRLLDTVQFYLDSYLEKNPSDFLIKAATDLIQSSKDIRGLEEVASQKSSQPETPNESTQKLKKTKRELLSTKKSDMWAPDTTKNPHVSVRRLSKIELSQITSKKSPETSMVQKKRKPPQAATDLIQSSKDIRGLEEVASQKSSQPETPNESTQKLKKTKRKLLSTKISDMWATDTTKNPHVSVRRLSKIA
ncbi:telomeric repeat-binding factor 1 isoform X2 [Melanotaenia boesemani]|uniref:telomeric repeat-binding factor 1 isoform X2 n=1 Tax=Melanotaenia boesemani TaxID=1250792 RepID=UPI001C04C168|nr:telomeric repeat-binding factor 1 isoform X2 [Melanotaenia boesemani]